ncbi:DUF937 domain-containing protein [Subsaximicrobium wynnwilliamsii]|uniref:DUF937 domain-containing protein n=1 Tax=Subsaximicrobium wynnwilliamsii TaxID=291179 RepID=UPI0021D1B223|nr:DUF937 domain-containing protein [Subsaximicrobium wynnwilliamsii]
MLCPFKTSQPTNQPTNQPQDKTQSVLFMTMPALMDALKRNASTPQGAEALLNALKLEQA